MHRPAAAFASLLLIIVWSAAAVGRAEETVAGEVVDVQCYLRSADNVGTEHEDCALSCAKKGATLGILADDGVYTITGDYAAAANEKLIEFVARRVEATGAVTERDGRKLIAVTSLKRLD
jgi:hypothetical protein